MNHESYDTEEPALGAPLQSPPVINVEGGHDLNDQIANMIHPLLYRTYIAAHILRLGTEARYSALIFLHRYVDAMNRNSSTLKRPTKWVAAACLFLASKAEEEPRRLRDMINLAHIVLDECDSGNNSKGKTGIIHLQQDPPPLNEGYWEAKKKIVETEQKVLRWLGFDAFVPHPHRAVALLIQHLSLIDQELMAPIVARRLNDSLFHAPALRHSVLELASAAIELAQLELGGKVTRMKQGWWHQYGVSDARLQETMIQLQDATNVLERLSRNQTTPLQT